MTTESTNINARKKARVMVMQALYQWAMSDAELHVIELQYLEHNDPAKVDVSYFRELLYGIPKNLSDIDAVFLDELDRSLDDLNPIELAVLRVASYELLNRLDIPYKVVINEALSLAKRFGSTSGHKYVNGVLDNVAKKLRKVEVSQANKNE